MGELRLYQQELIQSVHNAWSEGYSAPCIVLPCGGGKSVIVAELAKQATQNNKKVLFIVHRKELCEQIFSTFVKWGVNMELCQIGMVQTICRRLEKIPKPNLIITDENHHSKATSYRKVYDYFADVPRVGVTATPVRLDGSGLRDVNDILVQGVTAKWLIDNNFLAPYDYYAPPVTQDYKFKTRMGEYLASDIFEKLNNEKIYVDVIKYYTALSSGKKTICYCANVAHSKKTAEMFNIHGIVAAHIDGETPAGERDRIISNFRKGYITILCNVDLISEGFDVPDCECVILLRPTKSLTLFIQQSMRCMRYKQNKRAIILDCVNNIKTHSLPDLDREWDLDGQKKQKETAPTKICKECYAVVISNAKECPHCGYKFEFKSKQKCIKQEQLHKVDIESERLRQRVRKMLTPAECQNMKELQEYAKQKGYKPGWAYYQAKSRGFLGATKQQRNSNTKRYPCRAIKGWDSGA